MESVLIYFMEGSVMFDFCRPMMSPDKSLVLVLLIFTLKLLPSLFSTFEYATEFHLFSWTVFDRMLLFCSIEPTRIRVDIRVDFLLSNLKLSERNEFDYVAGLEI
jgi:hypothetical protein